MIDSSSEAFVFMEGERTYTCRIAALRSDRPERWWWLTVSGDRSRHAPFRAEPDDTEPSVRRRMVEYYEDRIARRGLGDTRGWGGARPRQH
ncbi:MAG TPA: hypothetical protein VFX39_09360 [Gemmatimonadaceae bacterium]|nr:hypothetical protein [Gemmatimonadaceae bacterium]